MANLNGGLQFVEVLNASVAQFYSPNWDDCNWINFKVICMMEIHEDHFNSLDHDMTMKILKCLSEPGDIVRVSSVSRSLRDFIILNAMSKQFCVKLFPQLSAVVDTEEYGNKMEKPAEVGCSSSNEWEHAAREHRIYATLAHTLLTFEPVSCISEAMYASSTDNYPEESIFNTLDRRDRIGDRASYWSSSGKSDPWVPETLTYKLVSDFCVITEINIHPFQAYFQPNSPIYSAKAVRFRFGLQIAPDHEVELLDNRRFSKKSPDDCFVWNYTSPEFAMTQECKLQHFKLPHPVLCIGGILQVELLVMGRSLFPLFGAENVEPSGRFTLKFNPRARFPAPQLPDVSLHQSLLANVAPEMMTRDVGGWEHVLNILRGNLGVEVFLSDDEENQESESESESDDVVI
ncbi:hypothetical protein V2J09_005170 [Rumex salicifolius]